MDATERFAELVRRPPHEIPLDEAAILLAEHAHPDLDPKVPLAELDRLAAGVAEPSAAAIARALFHDGGFAGNTDDYTDPRNSYLDDVLVRRLGIPISLSVVMIEVGRRCGVPIAGVGMPGHFLVQPVAETDVWFDPFHGGRRLDVDGCRARFRQVLGPAVQFAPELLVRVETPSILSRMLANLQNTFIRRDPAALPWVVRLRLLIPGLALEERRRLAILLRDSGRFGEAATILESLAGEEEGELAEELRRDAAATRARAN